MKKIIVPTDFTPVSEAAIKYACEIGNVIGSDVFLLHIVKKTADLREAEEKINHQIAQQKSLFGHKLQYITRVGNIFDDIPAVAAEEKAELVVMGTHGLQGMQFIVGSHALRIISESTVPMIIVQAGNQKSAKVTKLLVPLDLHKETKQKLKIAGDVAERFKAEVHILSPKENDEFLHNRIARNVSYSEGFLEDRKIPYTTKVTDAGSSGFVKELLSYAKTNGVDLICILNTSDDQIIHAFGSDSEQKIITNEALIPVMIMNPTHTMIDSASIFAQ